MKPRTKRESYIVGLADQLPPLTERQLSYPKEKIFKHYGYYWKNGKVWCQCCGHIYRQDCSILAVSLELDSENCPHCGATISLRHFLEAHGKENDESVNYTVVTTFRGYQVLRTFEARRFNRQGWETIYGVREVYQNWLDGEGRETIVSKSYNRSPFYFRWNHYSPWGIQRHNDSYKGSYAMDDVFDVTENWFYPRATVTPLLRQHGWRSGFLRMSGVSTFDLMASLMENSDMEMLAKTGQHDIMRLWMRRGFHLSKDRQNDYFHAIKVCNRNHYIVKDAALWYDLLDALDYLGLDAHNAHYVCPADLKAAHDLYTARMARVKARREREKREKEARRSEDSYRREKGKYFGICFGNERVVITVIKSVQEMLEEGRHMHHCVYDNGYYKKKEALILSAKKKEDGSRIETVELNLNTYAVVQSRGLQNMTTPYHDEIVGLVKDNIGLFKKIA